MRFILSPLAAPVILVALAIGCAGSAAPTVTPAPTATVAPPINPPAQTSTRAAATTPPNNTPSPASASPTAATAPDGPVITADIRDFSLPELSVSVGATVVWTNQDSAPHTVTAGAPGKASGLWNSGPLSGGQSFRRVFSEVGEYQYFCSIHTDMEATIRVGAATTDPVVPTTAAPAPTQAATPEAQATTVAAPATPTSEPAAVSGPRQSAIKGFSLESFTVPVGATVVWENQDGARHTVTATGGEFDSGPLSQNDTYRFTFTRAGTFSYFCQIHPAMKATVTAQ